MDGNALEPIKDSAFDGKVVDAIEREMLEDEDNMPNQLFTDEGVIRKRVAEIKHLLSEEEFILDNLLKMSRQITSVKKV